MVALKEYSRGDFVSINQISNSGSEASVGRPVWATVHNPPQWLVQVGEGRMARVAEVTRHQRKGNFRSPSFCGLAK